METKSRFIILKLSNNGLHYNEAGMFSWEQTNFPPTSAFTIKSHSDVYWKVEMESYDKEKEALFIKVVDYASDEIANFKTQALKSPIHKIIFRPIIWEELETCLSYYTPKEFDKIIQKEIPLFVNPLERINLKKEKSKSIEIHFKHPLMDTQFKMGYVELVKEIKTLEEPLTIQIQNDNILPEFDYIKPYFSKVLGSRNIEIKGMALIQENGEIQTTCTSKEIEKINEEFITNVKFARLKKAIEAPRVLAVDKSLFTPEEFFDGFEEEPEQLGNTLRVSEKDILKAVLDKQGVRNKKHLEYLSGKLQSNDEKIRFTLHPDFGFLFCVKGEKKDHFIWELLNSHATYIWSFPKADSSIAKQYASVEEMISFIRTNGRNEFLRNIDSEIAFSKIIHEKAESKLVNGFPIWKARLKEHLE